MSCGTDQECPQGLCYHTPSADLLWKSEIRLKKDKTGDAMGRPSRESSLLSDPGAKFFWENGEQAKK
jgi:hypothetical protein